MKKDDLRDALSKTRKATFGRLASLFGATDLTQAFWEELEETMIQADMGVVYSTRIIEDLQGITKREGILRGDQLYERLRQLLISKLQVAHERKVTDGPFVTIVTGVNGSGKTTTVARLARRWIQSGKEVLLAAADTYRAAANEQLELWAERLGIEIIKGIPGSDPGAVVYDASQAALARKMDALIIDTSGRMHTHHNLMAELQKVCRVAGKVIHDSPHEVLLVLDATTGQNGISQAKAFLDAIAISGVVVAKLDNSARGGFGLGITSELELPILYVGLGEGIDDLLPFQPEAYIDGLLSAADRSN